MKFEKNFFDKHFWISENQILYDGCPKDKWIPNFFSYSVNRITVFCEFPVNSLTVFCE